MVDFAAGQQSASDTRDEQELIRLEGELPGIMMRSDVERFSELMAEDWSTIDPQGHVITKQQAAEMLRSSTLKVESMSADDLRVRVYGDAAVVTGRGDYRLAGRGLGVTDYAGATFRFTDVWVRGAGKWRCVATQQTLIAAGAGQP